MIKTYYSPLARPLLILNTSRRAVICTLILFLRLVLIFFGSCVASGISSQISNFHISWRTFFSSPSEIPIFPRKIFFLLGITETLGGVLVHIIVDILNLAMDAKTNRVDVAIIKGLFMELVMEYIHSTLRVYSWLHISLRESPILVCSVYY